MSTTHKVTFLQRHRNAEMDQISLFIINCFFHWPEAIGGIRDDALSERGGTPGERRVGRQGNGNVRSMGTPYVGRSARFQRIRISSPAPFNFALVDKPRSVRLTHRLTAHPPT
jgi:hypothetical protein